MKFQAENLDVERGGRRLLSGFSCALDEGDALIVTGPNGAGKSTLLRVFAGLLAPAGGCLSGPGELLEISHLLGHKDGVKDSLSVLENACFWRDLFGGAGNAEEALGRVGLGALADFPAGVLSAGQRRRLALARLLVAPRPLWLLDEPTTALDRAGCAVLSELVAEHRAAGGMVVAATHSPLDWPGAVVLDLGERP